VIIKIIKRLKLFLVLSTPLVANLSGAMDMKTGKNFEKGRDHVKSATTDTTQMIHVVFAMDHQLYISSSLPTSSYCQHVYLRKLTSMVSCVMVSWHSGDQTHHSWPGQPEYFWWFQGGKGHLWWFRRIQLLPTIYLQHLSSCIWHSKHALESGCSSWDNRLDSVNELWQNIAEVNPI